MLLISHNYKPHSTTPGEITFGHSSGYKSLLEEHGIVPGQRGVSNCFLSDVSGVKKGKFAVLSRVKEGLERIG
jgi:hypothetical protein